MMLGNVDVSPMIFLLEHIDLGIMFVGFIWLVGLERRLASIATDISWIKQKILSTGNVNSPNKKEEKL